MDKRLITGTVAGGITLFVLGYLIYGLALADFFAGNAGGATGVARDTVIMWAIAVGEFSIAALVTLALGWTGASSMRDGFKTAALVGFLVWLGADFIHYGVHDVANLIKWFVELARGRRHYTGHNVDLRRRLRQLAAKYRTLLHQTRKTPIY